MTAHVMAVRTYVGVLVLLIAMTLLTVGVSFLPLSGAWHIAAGLSVGGVKAALVVLFFMHAIHSPRLTWIVIVVALGWLLILFSLTFCDYLTRHVMSLSGN